MIVHFQIHVMKFWLQVSLLSFFVQSVSLYIDMKMMRSCCSCGWNFLTRHHYLDLWEQLYRSVPWENLPLEHDRLCCDVVEFLILWRRDEMRN